MTKRILLAVAVIASTAAAAHAQDLFLTRAQIVDPVAQEVRQANLLILNGAIAGYPDEAPAGFSGETVDLDGQWVIPGLNDLHTHSYGNWALGDVSEFVGTAQVSRWMLYAGVTGFLDLFAPEAILALRDQRRRTGQARGADLFAAGPCITATNGHCAQFGIPTRLINTPEEAQREIADLARQKPDVIKLVYASEGALPSIDKATLEAAVATAKAHGINTVVHVETWQDVRDAALAGATAVTHLPTSGAVPDDLPGLLRERGVYSIPTLATHTDVVVFVEEPALLERPLAVAVTTRVLREAYRKETLTDTDRAVVTAAAQHREAMLASVKKLADAGVPILIGTDAGNPGAIQGYSVHRELALLVEAGLTPWQALAGATTLAGDFLGRAYGVRPGDEANLVVLTASPLEDIRNTERIALVIHHGVRIDRAGLLEAGVSGSP